MRTKFGTVLAGFAAVAAQVATASPTVTAVNMSQPARAGQVTITYTLADAPAVVTLDVETNVVVNGETVGWASIGGEHICNAQGDVWKKVGSSGSFNGTITWRPDRSWTDESGNGFKIDGTTYKARAVVTAWRLDNTPDYMVVNIAKGAQANTQRYYPAVDFLPGSEIGQKGAITNNPAYTEGLLVMRKIMAKDVIWMMGSNSLEPGRNTNGNGAANTGTDVEAAHEVMLTNNYYIGVFEVTQGQWAEVQSARSAPSKFNNSAYANRRPVEQVCYNEIRNAANSTTADTTCDWPNGPNENSFLGILRNRTGIDFDLPSEAQWEFAARGGRGSGKWGNGSTMLMTYDSSYAKHYAKCTNLDKYGRYGWNGGYTSWTGYRNGAYAHGGADCDPSSCTAMVGSYEPNDWGLYDMAGNVWEWCLDWYSADITANGGYVNIKLDTPSQTLAGTAGSSRVVRGGSWRWGASLARPAHRSAYAGSARNDGSNTADAGDRGFRLCCRAGLE